jgi:hypothetical protein
VEGRLRTVGHDDVVGRDEAAERDAPVLALEVERDAALAGVEVQERGAGFGLRRAVREGPLPPQRVADTGALHFHDVGAEVAEQLGAVGTTDAGGQLEHPFARERAGARPVRGTRM